MKYDYKFIFTENLNKWVLTTLDGRIIFESRYKQQYAALEECKAYVSSWNSTIIITKEEYEQEKQRDNVHKSSSGKNA